MLNAKKIAAGAKQLVPQSLTPSHSFPGAGVIPIVAIGSHASVSRSLLGRGKEGRANRRNLHVPIGLRAPVLQGLLTLRFALRSCCGLPENLVQVPGMDLRFAKTRVTQNFAKQRQVSLNAADK